MLLTDGTELKAVRWKDPYVSYLRGEGGCKNLTVSIEAGGALWVLIEMKTVYIMRPLTGILSVALLAKDPEDTVEGE